jgi:hypothetical protein
MIQNQALISRIAAFIELGKVLGRSADSLSLTDSDFIDDYPEFHKSLIAASESNPWFIPASIVSALNAWKESLTKEAINEWVKEYEISKKETEARKVAVIMAGNIPFVGFHDFLCVLLSGHYFIGKLSSDDKILLPAISEVLCQIEPRFKKMIHFTGNTIRDFDAVIATGSNNTARYFEYYFSKYPHIIRKNRNGIAILSGNESDDSLRKLGSDICMYFGLGCRNVSKVFIPEGFAPEKLFTAIEPYKMIFNNHYKYMNNYSYQRSVLLLNKSPHLDNGVFILSESEHYSSPIPILYYEYYTTLESLNQKLNSDGDYIQCIATELFTNKKTVQPGRTQTPGLGDYADGIDTMKFLSVL